jgi:hypothetical protein
MAREARRCNPRPILSLLAADAANSTAAAYEARARDYR